jgi:hypothetical protein
MANAVEKVNTIAIASIEAINTRTDANIEKLNTLEFANAASWTTTTSISSSRSRRLTGGAGGEGDHVLMGGYSDANGRLPYTDEWNGSSWSTSSNSPGNYLQGYYGHGSSGTSSSDAASFGGYRYYAGTWEYNGSSWSSGGAMGTGRTGVTGCGASQNAALALGGETSSSKVSITDEYNGSSWSGGGSYPSNIAAAGCTGIVTAAVAAYGTNGSANVATSAEYNGTSWSSGATATLAVGQGPQAWGAAYDDAHFSGTSGEKAGHETYNGSSFSTATDHNTGRTSGGHGGGARAGFVATGSGASAVTATCEKWT